MPSGLDATLCPGTQPELLKPGSAVFRMWAKEGLSGKDPTLAELRKQLAQFGKNHLEDRNKYLPTASDFDGFFRNVFHLNAEEEPNTPTIRRILSSDCGLVHAACSDAGAPWLARLANMAGSRLGGTW